MICREFKLDDNLLTCKKLSKTPNTSCKGSFKVRTRSDLHVQAEKYQEQT
ncbi:MAG TPA: hypothetical protein DCR37_10315 [Glaciecola sp.]|nr:hypothetical protein [Glaciecola sp.]